MVITLRPDPLSLYHNIDPLTNQPNPLTGTFLIAPRGLKLCAKKMGEFVSTLVVLLRKAKGLPDGRPVKVELTQNGSDDSALVLLIKIPLISSYARPGSQSSQVRDSPHPILT